MMTIFRAFRSPSNVKRAYDELNRTGNSVFLNRNRCGSLSHDNYNNNVSKLTENVLRGFLKPGALP